jgi:hypothetical protein
LALVALQVVDGADVYFFRVHMLGESPLKPLIDLIAAGHPVAGS